MSSATYIRCQSERHLMKDSSGTLLHAGLPESSREMLSRYADTVQTVYLDPPFNTGKRFEMRARVGEKGYRTGSPALTLEAYDDRWESREAYLQMMRAALETARGLLRREGTVFVHIDARMSAHMRLLMDDVFGENNFLNEIVWAYQTGGRARSYFPRKHDTILFYAKSRSYYFNLKAVPVARAETRSNHMRRGVDEDGRTYRAINSGGREYRYYDDEPAYPGDVWNDVSHLQQKDPQRTGYDTQKPLRLLERIVSCSTQEGDTVCDLFCGSGTTAVGAAGPPLPLRGQEHARRLGDGQTAAAARRQAAGGPGLRGGGRMRPGRLPSRRRGLPSHQLLHGAPARLRQPGRARRGHRGAGRRGHVVGGLFAGRQLPRARQERAHERVPDAGALAGDARLPRRAVRDDRGRLGETAVLPAQEEILSA